MTAWGSSPVPANHLLSRDETGWLDISDTSGIRDGVSTAAGWGGTFLDVDNDGQKDLLLVQGDRWNPGETVLPDGSDAQFDEPIHLLRQSGGQFTDIAADLGLTETGSFRAVLATDVNRDGVQDLLITRVSDSTLAYVSTGCTGQLGGRRCAHQLHHARDNRRYSADRLGTRGSRLQTSASPSTSAWAMTTSSTESR